MKNKFLKFSFAIVGLTIGLISCEKENQTTSENVLSLEAPEKIISFNKAVDEYNNFYNTRIAPFEGKSNSDKTRAVWFDLESLENHLEKIENVAQEKGIEVSGLSFILGADSNNKRTVMIAPMTFDPEIEVCRAFSFDNNELTYIYGDTFANYSSTTDTSNLTSTEESLILGANAYISSAEGIKMYNNYYDSKTKPIAHIIEKDTRVCMYEKGLFKDYLNYIKQQALNNKVNISGINIVFGVYGDNPTLGKDFANHQTLFFAPTELKNKNNFKTSYSFDGKKIIELDFNKNTLEKTFSKDNNIESSSIANELHGSPPNPSDIIVHN